MQEMAKMIAVVQREAQEEIANRHGKWVNRPNKIRAEILEKRRQKQGAAYHGYQLGRELLEWLPEIMDCRGKWRDPIDPAELSELLLAFVPESGHELLEVLDGSLKKVLPRSQLSSTINITKAHLLAGVPHTPAYQELGQYLMQHSREEAGAPEEDIADCAWTIASAQEELPAIYFDAFRTGLVLGKRWLSPDRLQKLGRYSAEVGLSIPQVFGTPPFLADAGASKQVWAALAGHLVSGQATVLHAEPTPLVSIPNVISPKDTEALLQLADEGNLWRPAARRGGDGTPVPGTPWSALLDRPQHHMQRAAWSLRLWVADTLGVPVGTVEPVRLVRHREGEGSLRPSADARPPMESSLWEQGQRTAVAMVFLSTLQPGDGGEIVFGDLGNLHVTPHAGTALLWPTVNMSGFPEPRMARSALPILNEGVVKYTAITWVRSLEARGSGAAAPR